MGFFTRKTHKEKLAAETLKLQHLRSQRTETEQLSGIVSQQQKERTRIDTARQKSHPGFNKLMKGAQQFAGDIADKQVAHEKSRKKKKDNPFEFF